jgi:hypothetical protein
MSATETLRLVISADAKGAIKEIDALGKKSERELNKATDSIDKWSAGLQRGGAIAIAAGAAVAGGLFKMAQASSNAQTQQLKLQNALNNNPNVINKSTKAFEAQAKAIQSKTAADADQIVAAQGMLATFRLTEQQLKDITPLVVDYSRRFGVDLVQAATTVGKAIQGQKGALQRQGIFLDENAYKADKFSAVMQALRENAGGFAEQEGKTFNGQLARLKNQLGDVAEGIGGGAVGAFSALIGPVSTAAEKFSELPPSLQETIGKVGALGAAAAVSGGGVAILAGKALEMRDTLIELSETAPRATRALAGLGIIGGAIALTAIGFDALSKATEAVTHNTERYNQALADVKSAKGAADALEKFNKAANHTVGVLDQLGGAWKFSSRNISEAEHRFDVFKDLLEESPAAAQQVVAGMSAAGESTGKYQREIDKVVGAMALQQRGSEELNLAAQKRIQALQDEADGIDEATRALLNKQAAERGSYDSSIALSNASLNAADAFDKWRDASNEAAAAGGTNEQANRAQERAANDLKGAIATVGDTAIDAAAKQAELEGRTLSAADKAKIQFDALQGLKNQFPELRGLVDAYLQKIGETPEAQAELARLRELFAGVTAERMRIRQDPGSGFGKRAGGGPVQRGEPYLVGERGPEMFVPTASGTVLSTDRLAGMRPPATGGNSYSITVNASPTSDPASIGAEVVKMIQQFERRSGTSWRRN